MCVFGDLLTYSGGTDRPVELCYNFSVSNDLTQVGNFPTRILVCDSHSPALLDLFHSSDASIYSTMAFPTLGNSAGFDLTTHNLYFTILVEIFMNHILAEDIFHKSHRVNRTQDYDFKTSKPVPNYMTLT